MCFGVIGSIVSDVIIIPMWLSDVFICDYVVSVSFPYFHVARVIWSVVLKCILVGSWNLDVAAIVRSVYNGV